MRRFVYLALISLVSVGTIACGGDDGNGASPATTDGASTPADPGGELTLEQYFTRIDDIFERSDAELDTLDADLQAAAEAGDTVEEGVEALETFADGSVEVFSRSLDELEATNEPAEVDDPHGAFVSAIGDALSATEQLRDELDSVQTAEDLELASTRFGESFTPIGEAADAACNDLQSIADDANIEVDLNCED